MPAGLNRLASRLTLSVSENLDYKHRMNVSRIGKVIGDKPVPTDEEILA
jgi:succinate-semialdehyde dehydrogenase